MPDTLLQSLTVTPISPAIGAVVTGLDLTRPLSQETVAALDRALVERQVLFFENQPLTPRQHRDLAARFGDLHIHPIYPRVPDQPEIIVLDTHAENPTDNDNWHTDVTFIRTPPKAAVLSAKLIPPGGGDTLWASSFAAYEALSEPFKRLLDGLRAVHDFEKSFPPGRFATPEAAADWQRARAANPPVEHPVVRTHPVSGRRGLFVNEGFTTRILGLGQKESDAVLRFLFEHASKPEFTLRWRWKVGDLAIWDNRSTQHYAVNDYLPHRRIVHRATVLGDQPY